MSDFVGGRRRRNRRVSFAPFYELVCTIVKKKKERVRAILKALPARKYERKVFVYKAAFSAGAQNPTSRSAITTNKTLADNDPEIFLDVL